MTDFVLIHGSWMGAWAWDRVAAVLRNAGHTADAIDLPGDADDASARGGISLQAYADSALAAIEVPQVILEAVGR